MEPTFDNEASLREARSRLPFEQLLTSLGHGPQNGNWKSFACPHCHKKKKAGLFDADGARLFKCQSTTCPTGARAMDDVGYLAFTTGRSRADAFADFLRMAGVWRERQRYQAPTQSSQVTQPPLAAPANQPASSPGESSGITASSESAIPSNQTQSAAQDEALLSSESTASHDEVEPAEPVHENVEQALEALRWFYQRLTLTAADEQLLYDKRGLGRSAVQLLGFKSNGRVNLELLRGMGQHFPAEVLMESGLWQRAPAGTEASARPNRQFHGYGRTGRKVEGDDDGFEKEEWGWANPILIPYFNAAGELEFMRPHKGGIKGHPAHLYVPRPGGRPMEEKFETVIITEGEFKAAALWQVCRGAFGIAAMPGIQMANNYGCREELEDWLRKVGAKRAVVIYDNADHSNPALSEYKTDYEKRFEATKWARVLALRLSERMRIKTAVWDLPKEWRDRSGKADWDGALAAFVKARTVHA